MRDLLIESLESAMVSLQKQAQLVELVNVDESTFRSFVMAEIQQRCARARLQTEWERIDLLINVDNDFAAVEFKFYVHRRHFDLTGEFVRWKGCAGPKNTREFETCLSKLRRLHWPEIGNRFLVLVYENDNTVDRKFRFHDAYDDLTEYEVHGDQLFVIRSPLRDVTCKLLKVGQLDSTKLVDGVVLS
ncbi:MAG TPA: hypothetical protein VHD36_18715 [Pirellulales bacterium]|nr:hypothetical protein [Pirellulales bacterium]